MKKRTDIKDGMTRGGKCIKNIFDITVSCILFILLSPIFIITYIAIKKEDNGPIFYKQERIGKYGKPFMIYKFRSMKVNAEENGPELYKGKLDTRITKVGKFLRIHHLDEIPQLINVIKGEMSFVGPRPERMFYIEQILEKDDRYKYLYQVKPGVTSYATLHNGYCDTLDKMLIRLKTDLIYIEKRSIWTDLKIMVYTVIKVVTGKKF